MSLAALSKPCRLLTIIAQPHINRWDDENRQYRRGGKAKNERDRKTLEDRVGDDEGRADHRRRRGEEDRLEPDCSCFKERLAQHRAFRAPVADEIDEQDRIAHDDARERNKAIIEVAVKGAYRCLAAE